MIQWIERGSQGRSTTKRYITIAPEEKKGVVSRTAIRLSRSFLSDYGLSIGDRLSVGYDQETNSIAFKTDNKNGYVLTKANDQGMARLAISISKLPLKINDNIYPEKENVHKIGEVLLITL